MRRPLVLAIFLSFGSLAASGATFIVPDDREMIGRADAIVVADVVEIGSRWSGPSIVTDVDLTVRSALKGTFVPGEALQITEPGGVIGLTAEVRSATPRYLEKTRHLIFLERTAEGWRTWGSMLGKFDFVDSTSGLTLLLRGSDSEPIQGWTASGERHVERTRDAGRFVDFIRKSVVGGEPSADYHVSARPRAVRPREGSSALAPSVQSHGFPASAYTAPPESRWLRFEQGGNVVFQVARIQPGYDIAGSVQRATAAWSNDSASNIDYRYGGTTTGTFAKDGRNLILGAAPEFIPQGSLGYAAWYLEGQHNHLGEVFWTIIEGDVVVTNVSSLSQQSYDEIVTHELGHTLGLRHSDQDVPSSTLAVMRAVISGAYGASLGPWDQEAIAHVYPGGSANIDVDGNGRKEALTDGLLILRYLFGFRGPTLINGAIGSGATRTTPAAIEAYIASIQPALDVDGNGSREALTDGLLILRYLFGFRGDTLVRGAIGAGATRSTAQIEAYIATL